jgi:cytochrome bd-type quinol oxidase subunit 2
MQAPPTLSAPRKVNRKTFWIIVVLVATILIPAIIGFIVAWSQQGVKMTPGSMDPNKNPAHVRFY